MQWPRRKRGRKLLGTGQVFIVSAFLLLLAAWNSGINLFYLLFGAILSFLFLAMLMCRAGIKQLTIEREAPAAVNRREPFGVTVLITNKNRILPAIGVQVSPRRTSRSRENTGYCLYIPAGRTAQLRMTHQFDRRGVHSLPELELASSFPFGLIEAWKRVSDNREIVVYPAVLSVRTAVMEQLGGSGQMPKTARGHGDEFFSLREYVPGDEPRHIAWRASARTGTLMVRELERQTSRFVTFIFDSRLRTDIEGFADHFEDAIDLIASLTVTFLARQYVVAIATATAHLPRGEGSSHVLKALEMLARLEPADPDAPDPVSAALQDAEDHAASYLIVSPDPSQWGQPRLPVRTRILDPREVIHA